MMTVVDKIEWKETHLFRIIFSVRYSMLVVVLQNKRKLSRTMCVCVCVCVCG